MPLQTLTFVVPGDPLPKGSTTAFVVGGIAHVTSSQRGMKAWEQRVALAASFAAQGVRFYGPIWMHVLFYLTRPASLPKSVQYHLKAPDTDKLCRAIGDACACVLYDDDKQIVQWTATKHYAGPNELPRVSIAVSGNTDNQSKNWHSPGDVIKPIEQAPLFRLVDK